MPEVQQGNTLIHYQVSGSGPPVVLLHSFLCSGAMWQPQLQPLSEHYQLINIDLRGHGGSGPCTEPFVLNELLVDALAVLDRLEIERAVWAGLSIGGMIALRAALNAGHRVAGLILLDSDAGCETRYKKLKYKMLVALAGLIGTAPLIPLVLKLFFCKETRRSKPELVRTWQQRMAAVPLATIRNGVAALIRRNTLLDRLGSVTAPALVIVGAEDASLPPSCSQRLAAALANAELLVIEQAGHLSNLEQPEQVTAAMLEYLDAINATRMP